MARQPKLWTYQAGRRGQRAAAREWTLGGNGWLFAYDRSLNPYRKHSLGFQIRDERALVAADVVRAEAATDELSPGSARGARSNPSPRS